MSRTFIRLQASEACTACGVCGRVCPTGALQFEQTDTFQYQLTFQSAVCTDCGVCLDLCEPHALTRSGSVTPAQAIQPAPITLRAGQARTCSKCGTRFAGSDTTDLCPVCDFRRRNPFGSRMPAGWTRRGGPGSSSEGQ